MISNAIQSALSGLKTSSMRFEQAASGVVQSGTQTGVNQASLSGTPAVPSFPTGPVQQNGAAQQSAPVQQNTSALTQIKSEQPDLASSAVSMQEAAFSYKANAKVLEVLGEMQGELFKKDV